MHARGVHTWVRAIEDILVELSCEVTSETMNFSLILLHSEDYFIEFLHACTLALTIPRYVFIDLFIFSLRVRQVSECKYLLGLLTAGERSREYSDNVW
jgi:hypothetical protein